jgi:hypothetical protein
VRNGLEHRLHCCFTLLSARSRRIRPPFAAVS